MIINELNYALIQVVGVSVVSFVVTGASGSFFALITGGDLAIYYATNSFAEKHQWRQGQVSVLQGTLIGLYNIALTTAFVAFGVINFLSVSPIYVILTILFMIPPVASIKLGVDEHNPLWDNDQILVQALPKSLMDFRFLRSFREDAYFPIEQINELSVQEIEWDSLKRAG